MQSQSKSNQAFGINYNLILKIYMKCKERNNFEKEEHSSKTYSTLFQDLQ